MSTGSTPTATVHLEVNDSGAWRRVCSFDARWFKAGDLETCAQHLLEMGTNQRLRARVIAPGCTAPISVWTREQGWRDWGEARAAASTAERRP